MPETDLPRASMMIRRHQLRPPTLRDLQDLPSRAANQGIHIRSNATGEI
ncbi:MAG: hypothetical protein GF393_03020 [Armatimonadia bacterium]|nr:hypothetical protein [Armatimonadia bacterium]